MLYGVYVRQTKAVPYANYIVAGLKTLETRTRNTLGRFVGRRVFIIRTMANREPMVIGSVRIVSACFRSADWLDEHRNETMIPDGDQFDCHGKGKWVYGLADPDWYTIPCELKYYSVARRTRTFVEIV